MVIIIGILVVTTGATCYWLGRGRRLNRKIKYCPEDIAVNPTTGEVIERGTPAWEFAERVGSIHKKVEFK